jgi:hypothetical protein
MELFDAHNPSAEAEYRLADIMREQWKADLATVKERGIIPDWIGEPKPLAKDKAAFLELILRNGSVTWTSAPSRGNNEIALTMGYKQRDKECDAFNLFDNRESINITASAKAAIKSLAQAGLIEGRPVENGIEYSMTLEGEYALEDWQSERELGFV